MAHFKSDLAAEQILSQHLDQIYASLGLDFKRVYNLDLQRQGVDLELQYNNKIYWVDEKAQLHYLNSKLPTFTFELSYLKDNELRQGWLFDPQKTSQYYFLITGISLKNNKPQLSDSSDIENLCITSVNRQKLITHLAKKKLTQENLAKYEHALRHNNTFGRYKIPELKPKKEGVLYYTQHLKEQPINLQLRIDYMIETGVAKSLHLPKL